MSEPPIRVPRRKYLRILGAAAVAAAAAVLAVYDYSIYSTRQTSATLRATTTAPTSTMSPVVRYALERGIASSIAHKLAGLSDLDEKSKFLVDYLCTVGELVGPEESDRQARIESLQTKVLEGSQGFSGILTDGALSQEEADGLRYLASFRGDTQIGYIDFGLDDVVASYLSTLSLLPHDFATWAVETKFLIEDHKLTELKMSCLKDPERYGTDVLNSLISDAKSNETFSVLGEELEKIPEVRSAQKKPELKITEAAEDIACSTLLSQDPYVTKNLEQILAEGIPKRREYCTPLQALLWYCIDREPDERNPLENPSFDVDDFVLRVWFESSTSNNFASEQWGDFDEVVPRLNSPYLLYWYMFYNIRYLYWSSTMADWFFYSPEDVFISRKGDCIPQASFATHCLTKNGWKAINLFLSYAETWDHAVCVYRDKSGSLYYLDNAFQPRRGIFGPFDSITLLAGEIDTSLRSLGRHPSDTYELCTYAHNYHCNWHSFLDSLRPVTEGIL